MFQNCLQNNHLRNVFSYHFNNQIVEKPAEKEEPPKNVEKSKPIIPKEIIKLCEETKQIKNETDKLLESQPILEKAASHKVTEPLIKQKSAPYSKTTTATGFTVKNTKQTEMLRKAVVPAPKIVVTNPKVFFRYENNKKGT